MAIFQIFDFGTASLMASVVAFVAFFLIARLARARQGVAFAFGFLPLLLFFALASAAP